MATKLLRLRNINLNVNPIVIPARRYEDEDNSLLAAERDVCAAKGLKVGQVSARWELDNDYDSRDTIVVELA